jgi:hypothetical protein
MKDLRHTSNSLLLRCAEMPCPFSGYVLLQRKAGMIRYFSDAGAQKLFINRAIVF